MTQADADPTPAPDPRLAELLRQAEAQAVELGDVIKIGAPALKALLDTGVNVDGRDVFLSKWIYRLRPHFRRMCELTEALADSIDFARSAADPGDGTPEAADRRSSDQDAREREMLLVGAATLLKRASEAGDADPEAGLIEFRADFDRCVATERVADARDDEATAGAAHERCKLLLGMLRDSRAVTPAGITGRLRTVLHYDRKLPDPHNEHSGGWDDDLRAMLIRDLAAMLQVEPEGRP